MSDPLVLKISGDTEDLKKSLAEINKNLKNTSRVVEKETKTSKLAFASFIGTIGGAAVTKAFGLINSGLRSFAGSLKESVALSKVQQEAVNELDNALVRTGKFTREASKDFQDFASSLQNSSKFGDEAILKNAALIQSFGNLSNDGLKVATKAAVDLAAATGSDLGAASKILSQAATGNVGPLRKLGVTFDATGDKTKDFAIALDLINEKFGSAAAQQLNTYDGATTQLGNTFGDLKEIIGSVVTENSTLRGVFQGLNAIALQLQASITSNKDAIQDFVSSGLRGLVGSLSIAGQGVNLFIDGLTILSTTFDGIRFLINETIRGFVNIASVAVSVVDSISKLTGVNSEFVSDAKAGLEELNATLAETSDGFIKDAANTIEANRQKKQAVSDFTSFAQDALFSAVANAESVSQAELDIEREKQSELALIRQQAKELEEENRVVGVEAFIANEAERLELIRSILGEEEALREEARARELAAKGDLIAASRSLEAAESKARKADIFAFQKFETLSQKEKVANLKSTLGTISSLQSSSSKELFAISKAANIATATMDGFQAVQKALASAPPPINVALAALVGAATAANIAKIASTKPPTGAFNGALVEGGSMFSDTQPFMLSKGEIVAPRRDFDDVVEGTARQRGFVKKDEAREEKSQSVVVNIQGDIIGDDQFVNNLIERIRDAVQFRNADLGVS